MHTMLQMLYNIVYENISALQDKKILLEEWSPCFYILASIDPRDLRLSAHAEVRVLEAASIYEAAKR